MRTFTLIFEEKKEITYCHVDWGESEKATESENRLAAIFHDKIADQFIDLTKKLPHAGYGFGKTFEEAEKKAQMMQDIVNSGLEGDD